MIYRFYYDFAFPSTVLMSSDLDRIKAEMRSIIRAKLKIVREEVSEIEAK